MPNKAVHRTPWRAPVIFDPRARVSSPIVTGGRVYFTTVTMDGEPRPRCINEK
jgi:hypothetical protein